MTEGQLYVLGGALVISTIEIIGGFYWDFKSSGKTFKEYSSNLGQRWMNFWNDSKFFNYDSEY